jgi:hypothetical protein
MSTATVRAGKQTGKTNVERDKQRPEYENTVKTPGAF